MGFRRGYVYVDGSELRRMPIQTVPRERLIHTPTPHHIPSDMHRALFSYAASSGISKTNSRLIGFDSRDLDIDNKFVGRASGVGGV